MSGELVENAPAGADESVVESVAEQGQPAATTPQANLAPDDVRDRLRVNSPELVKELYEIAKGQVAYETGRQGRLDSKATSLLTAAGLSVTVAFYFGTTLITYGSRFPWYVTVAYAAAVLFGLASAFCAVWALKVAGKYTTLSDDAVFSETELSKANLPTWDGDADVTDDDKRRFGVMRYQKHLIAHLWEVYQSNAAQNEGKASWVKAGQYVFLAFLVALMACAGLVFKVVSANEHQPSAAGSAGPATSTQTGARDVHPTESGNQGTAIGSARALEKGRDGG